MPHDFVNRKPSKKLKLKDWHLNVISALLVVAAVAVIKQF